MGPGNQRLSKRISKDLSKVLPRIKMMMDSTLVFEEVFDIPTIRELQVQLAIYQCLHIYILYIYMHL